MYLTLPYFLIHFPLFNHYFYPTSSPSTTKLQTANILSFKPYFAIQILSNVEIYCSSDDMPNCDLNWEYSSWLSQSLQIFPHQHIFSGNICIHSLLSWVVYTNMFPWELYDPSKIICILYLSCSAGYICICSLRNVAIFSLGLRPRENIATFLRGTYTYIPCRAWYIYTILIIVYLQEIIQSKL